MRGRLRFDGAGLRVRALATTYDIACYGQSRLAFTWPPATPLRRGRRVNSERSSALAPVTTGCTSSGRLQPHCAAGDLADAQPVGRRRRLDAKRRLSGPRRSTTVPVSRSRCGESRTGRTRRSRRAGASPPTVGGDVLRPGYSRVSRRHWPKSKGQSPDAVRLLGAAACSAAAHGRRSLQGLRRRLRRTAVVQFVMHLATTTSTRRGPKALRCRPRKRSPTHNAVAANANGRRPAGRRLLRRSSTWCASSAKAWPTRTSPHGFSSHHVPSSRTSRTSTRSSGCPPGCNSRRRQLAAPADSRLDDRRRNAFRYAHPPCVDDDLA